MQLATEKLEKTRTTARKLKYKRLDIKHRYGIKDKGMEERIMGSIRDIIKQEKDFDDQRLLLHLPQKLKRDIMLSICKSLFEKEPTLRKASEDRYLRHLICDSLKPVYLNEDTYIIRQGEVLDKMLFLNQGTCAPFQPKTKMELGVLRKVTSMEKSS
ncbi:Cyclic nucleotide-gated ion channel 1 [Morella rubra]|uniref:Cyclic nucleotide-gated ion channel 1 n=1 Tax=Morella rubra TaxID=262757 RepID=A0A6A1UK84_9ROSI|nr:Cyclic nucleotide-gated ion channel 1 [Morella rubra]